MEIRIRRISIAFLLLLATSLGAWLRITNKSNFLFYPDSYRFLIMARNLQQHFSVMGTLGPGGMPYEPGPYFVFRVGYPVFILLFDQFMHNLEQSAQILSLLAGISSIPLMYLLTKRIFDSTSAGIFGAFILAFSFTHTAWSGFALSETLAMFFILASLVFVFSGLTQNLPEYLNRADILAGIFAAFAILTRSEYLLLVLVILPLFIIKTEPYWGRVLTFLSITMSLITLAIIMTVPARNQIVTLLAEWKSQLILITIAFLALIVLMILTKRKTIYPKKASYLLPLYLISFLIAVFVTYLYAQIFFESIGVILPYSQFFTAIKIFARYDFLLFLTAMLGIIYLIFDSRYSYIGIWIMAYLFILAISYQRINILSYRYTFHFLPPLVISSSFFISRVSDWVVEPTEQSSLRKNWLKASLVCLLAILVVSWQVSVSLKSMKGWYSPVSYEQVSAAKVREIIKARQLSRDVIILSRLAEPYAYYTGKSVWRIDQEYPYILFFSQFPTKKPVLIVLDESVHRLAPKFAEFVQKNLSSFEIEAFFTGIPFHFGRYRYPEINPVRLYYLPAETLKDLLKKPHLNVLYYIISLQVS